jgi:hypothetical protein
VIGCANGADDHAPMEMKPSHLFALVALVLSCTGLLLVFEVVRPFRDLSSDGPLALIAWGAGAACGVGGFFLRERSVGLSLAALLLNVLPMGAMLALLWVMSRSSFVWR